MDLIKGIIWAMVFTALAVLLLVFVVAHATGGTPGWRTAQTGAIWDFVDAAPEPPPSGMVADTNLVFWYALQNQSEVDAGNYTNSSPTYPYHGTQELVAARATWDNGGDGSIDLDGVNDQFYVPDNTNLDGFGAFSIAAWVYPHVYSDNDQMIMSREKDGPGTTAAYYLSHRHGGAFVFLAGDTNSIYVFASNSVSDNIPTNEWAHVVATFHHPDTMNLYIDGNQVGVTGGKSGILTNVARWADEPTYVGAMDDGGLGRFFDGIIDEPMLWNRELTSNEAHRVWRLTTNGHDAGVIYLAVEDETECNGGYYEDWSGYLNTGMQATAEFRPVWVTNGLDFDGTNDYISVQDNYWLIPRSDDYTVLLWIKNGDIGTDRPEIFECQVDPQPDPLWQLWADGDSGYLKFVMRDTEDDTVTAQTDISIIEDDVWHHIGCVREDTTNLILYVDGVEKARASDLLLGDVDTGLWNLLIGKGNNGYYPGMIDKFEAYRMAYPSNAVKAAYDAGH